MKFKVLMILLMLPMVLAVDFDQDLSYGDQRALDEILEPVMKIYSGVKYVASVVAVIVLTIAGFNFFAANGESIKKDKAKQTIGSVILGLIVIWVAPLVIRYVFG